MVDDNIRLTIETLKIHRDKWKKGLNAIEETIALLENGVSSTTIIETATATDVSSAAISSSKPFGKVPAPAEYKQNTSWADKVLIILRTKKRFLRFRDIAAVILDYEGGDKNKVTPLANKISNACAHLKTSKAIIKVMPDKSNVNTFWGIPEWLDEKGEIIKGHEYDPSTLEKKI